MCRILFIAMFTLPFVPGPIAFPQPIVQERKVPSQHSTGDGPFRLLATDLRNSPPSQLDSVDQVNERSRFAIRLSAGLGGLTTSKLADALARYKHGEFDQAVVRAYGGIGLQVDLPASLQLSFVVDFSSGEFIFYPDLAVGRPWSEAAWEVTVVPITIFLCYSPPFMLGPVRTSVGVGGSYIVSTVEQTSNYAIGSTYEQADNPIAFGGFKKRDNGWGVDFNAAFVIELSRHVQAGLRGNYLVSAVNHHLPIMDPVHGIKTLDMDIRSTSLTVGFEFFFL